MGKKLFDMKARRIKLGLTLEGVALKAGLTPPAVRQIETGMTKATFLTKAKLADALDCTLRDLLTEEEIAAAEKFMEDEQEAQMSRRRKEPKKD